MQKLTKILIIHFLLAQPLMHAMDTLENELKFLHNRLTSLRKAFTPIAQTIKPEPLPQAEPKFKKFNALGERILPNGKKIIVGIGDVEKVENVDAVINAANKNLQFGSGVAGAIAAALGAEGVKQVYAEINAKYTTPVNVGSATPTSVPANTLLAQRGFKYIIHAVGPDCRDQEQSKNWQMLLASAYRNALTEAAKLNLKTITVPALSIGVFQCDYQTAITIMMGSITQALLQPSSLEEVLLVVWSGGQNNTATAQNWLAALDKAIRIATL
ncbi:MAG: macro domain-containing protein [Candidatus Babeliales bacterium]